MTALSIIISIVLILISIVLIVSVLLQEGQRQGLGAIGGGAETFFGKNLASSAEGKLKLITKIAAAVFVVLAIVATIITAQMTEDIDLSALTAETHVHEDGTVHAGAEHAESEDAATTEDAAASTEDAAAVTEDAAAATEDAAATTEDAAASTEDAADTAEADTAEDKAA